MKMNDEMFDKFFVIDDILTTLCEEMHWHERDALDLFFESGLYPRIMAGESVDHVAECEVLRSAGAGIEPIDEPAAIGCIYGCGVCSIVSTMLIFYQKYGVMPHILYPKFRKTQEFEDMITDAWIWCCRCSEEENFYDTEKLYCKLCHVRRVNDDGSRIPLRVRLFRKES